MDKETQKKYLKIIETSGLTVHAAKAMGINTQEVHHLLASDDGFSDAFNEAMNKFKDTLEAEIGRPGRDIFLVINNAAGDLKEGSWEKKYGKLKKFTKCSDELLLAVLKIRPLTDNQGKLVEQHILEPNKSPEQLLDERLDQVHKKLESFGKSGPLPDCCCDTQWKSYYSDPAYLYIQKEHEFLHKLMASLTK